MNHQEIKDKLDLFFDNELSVSERLELKSHLESCGECRQEVEDWVKISRAIFRKPNLMINPEHFTNEVMGRLGEYTPEKPVFTFSFLWRPVAFGFGVAVVLFMFFINPISSPVTVEELLLADNRSSSVPRWLFDEQRLASDELLVFALGEN